MAISISLDPSYIDQFKILERKEKKRESNKRWLSSHIERKRETDRLYQRNKRLSGAVDKTEEYRIWREKNPLAYRAQSILNGSIRAGETKRGICMVCGAKKAQGHHPDYSKPLEVDWLCPIHHAQEHARLRSENKNN